MGGMRRLTVTFGLLAVSVGGIALAEHWQQNANGDELAVLAMALPHAGFGPADQNAASAETDRNLMLSRERVAKDPQSWLARQMLSRALSRSYAVNGNFGSLVEAGQHLAAARASAPVGSGPNLVTAEWAMSVHDPALAEHGLDRFDAQRVKLSRSEESSAISLRGDLLFYTGNLSAAESLYARAAERENGPGVLVRQALVEKARGNFDRAIALLLQAGRIDSLRTPQTLADLAIQVGAIEFARGRYAEADDWYARAEQYLPDYWKTRLYAGEAALVAGRVEDAIRQFERVVDLNGAPEAMDALAMVYRRQGNRAKSLEWSERAKAEWVIRIDALPSAAIAHAAEHELAFGDARHALELARRNLATRPYGDARILLAKAFNANGRYADALAQLKAAQASGWNSALLYVELARSEEALGKAEAAQQAKDRAAELNPEIFTAQAGLVWFAHG